jgi:hypothetical protein
MSSYGRRRGKGEVVSARTEKRANRNRPHARGAPSKQDIVVDQENGSKYIKPNDSDKVSKFVPLSN